MSIDRATVQHTIHLPTDGWFLARWFWIVAFVAPRRIATLFVGISLTLSTTTAIAGGGPENVFLLVNVNSKSSKTIANHYIHLRKIPANNVLYIDWRGPLETCSGGVFHSQILAPSLKAIAERGLAAQIDYIIYSSDFPWRVDLSPLFPDEKFIEPFSPPGSITGATYLALYINAKNPSMLLPGINWYVPGLTAQNQSQCLQLGNVLSRGFRSRYLWDSEGNRTYDPSKGQQYVLSTMLGVTRGRGNTDAEVISYLERSAKADGTKPSGTIYFMKNEDIRSQTRHDCFGEVADQIRRKAVFAKVVSGILPTGAYDVAGLMTGAASFDLKAARVTVKPGAICDHLTSFGGVLSSNSSQTPLTDFLRAGAAGASGTITEPHAIQAKFPLPTVQLHYVRGCSLSEAFYQSISAPYQLLIVGDPLCQPWATFPRVAVTSVMPGEEVRGRLVITTTASAARGNTVAAIEFFVDGQLVLRGAPGQTFTVDTTNLPDGYHELRVVAIHADPIETQGRALVPIVVNNQNVPLEIVADLHGEVEVMESATIRVSVRQSGAKAITIRQNSREVARVKGESGEAYIPAEGLGAGPTTLQAVSEGDKPTVSRPLTVNVHYSARRR